MDLQQHPGLQIRIAQRAIHPQHRELDDVRSRTLNRRIERSALGVFPGHPVRAGQLRQVATATVEGLRVTGFLRRLDDLIQVALHAAETVEVVLHDPLGLARADA